MKIYRVSLVVNSMFAYIKSFFVRPPVEPEVFEAYREAPQVQEVWKPLETLLDTREQSPECPTVGRVADDKPLPDTDQDSPFTDLRISLQMTLASLTPEQAAKARAGLIYIFTGRAIKMDECMTTAEILDLIPQKNLGGARLFLEDLAR